MRAILRTVLPFAAALLAAVPGVDARKAAPARAPEKPKVVLVELFTSEGCSSCPPADALLRQVNGTRTSADQLIVGISEHVTYWNSLGWADPFSSAVYTDRQNGYGARFGLESVYTPQMVVNGTEQFVGSDQAGLTRAIQRQQAPAPIELHILATHQDGRTLSVSFSLSRELPPQGAEIIAVLADDADCSSVLRGENSGRTLAHVAVARSLVRVATLKGGAKGQQEKGLDEKAMGEQTAQIPIPPSFSNGQGHHLILFAQTPGYGRVLGADTKPL